MLNYERIAADIGYKPNKWQKEVEAVDARFKTIVVGRRGGKSLYVVKSPKDGLVHDLLTPNQFVWIVAPSYDLTQRVWSEFYNLCITKFPKELFTKMTNTKGNYMIKTALGTIIEAKSAEDPESLIGVGLTKVIIDEASRVKEKAWYQALRPTLVDHKGSAIFISTPKGKNWFYDMFKRGKNPDFPDYASFQYSSYDNEYIDKREIDEMVKDMPQYEYTQEIMAQFTEDAEAIFLIENIERLKEVVKIEGEGLKTMGIDLGKGFSYTVIVGLQEGACTRYERFQTSWNETIKRIYDVYQEDQPNFIRIDATGKGDPIVEQLLDAGIPVDSFIFTTTSKKQLLDKAALAVEKKLIKLPDLSEIYAELEVFGKVKTDSGNEIYKPLKKHSDDIVMAISMAIWDMNIDEDVMVEKKVIQYPIIEY